MISQLNFLNQLVLELRQNNSSNEKKIILAKYFEKDNNLFDKLMDYVYSFDKKYWLTSDNVEKMWDKFEHKNDFNDGQDLFVVLDKLINREITGHTALNYVKDLIIFCGEEYRDIIFCILNKDLKANTSISLINKVSPNAVKEFKVALAERFDEAPEIHQPDFNDGNWMVSRKLDGVRTISLINNNEVELFSRQGNTFQTLDVLKSEVKTLLAIAKEKYGEEFILDGECCLVDENGRDDFSGIMKQITRKNYSIQNPKYILFDLVKRKEFDAAIGTTPFSQRITMLNEIVKTSQFKFISVVQHKLSIREEDFAIWNKYVKENNWEGLVLRDQRSVYSGKRSFDLQKVKSFYDAEFEVTGIEKGKKKMLNDGKMVETECVTAINIVFKGTTVGVGSGLSDIERINWLKNPEEIIGKIVTVQYFEETIDARTGKPSLRFPTLKIVHGIQRNT